ncbi:histidine phosphatase family protein [Pontibacter harenae]|uniref:histidine phosphatase family protein n=1 Tax=Pontibacter harenae TaxID=2894083 RepID=UPI001E65388A|nr:histidine phosphatase family protein [Pontibacter harenae]MCC9166193.1 phosphoglycerate mutase family protein [Pontibacter harenae]
MDKQPTSSATSPPRIFLIRHARPLANKKGFFSASDAQQFIVDYDAAAVEEFILENEAIPFKEIRKVYCSTLNRSQLTAKAIFGDGIEMVKDHSFREFERRIFSFPLLKLPVKLWLVSARLLWFLGFNSKDIETFKQARQRAKAGAVILAAEATENKVAVLVAHGLLNKFIERELRKMGWQLTLNGGRGFVSVNVLSREV